MDRIKVMTILGTRPEIIRLSRVMVHLDESTEHIIVHTGQNYDHELNGIFFEQLSLRKPDYLLEVDVSSLGAVLGGILTKIEPLLRSERPDAVLILGDTNSSIAGLMAKRLRIPLYHMEAGNRCFDPNVPEEINRRIIDHIADFNLVYTEHARRHLLAEGLPHRRIYLTGSPMKEVLDYYRDQIMASTVLDEQGLEPRRFFLVSLHREENVDCKESLSRLLFILAQLSDSYGFPVVVSTHPRTRLRLAALGVQASERIRFCTPFGYFDYNRLQMNACCVLSDSGTVAEEAAILGFPAVTVRNAMERPEALDTGTILLTGVEPNTVLQSVHTIVMQYDRGARPEIPADYRVQNVSQRVVNLLIGTSRLSHIWDNIVPRDYL